MPAYEYKCEDGHVHERLNVRPSDYSPQRCPKCGKEAGRLFPQVQRPLNTGTPIHHTRTKL